MQDFFVAILLASSSWLGIQKIPTNTDVWSVETAWSKQENSWLLKVTSDSIQKTCDNDKVLILPQVIHGIHKVFVDEKLVFQSGDDTFQSTSAFYERGIVSCAILADAKVVTWTVQTYSEYFARVKKMPHVDSRNNSYNFFDVSLNIVAVGCLTILALFSLFLFRGRVENQYIICLTLGSLSLAAYSAFTCANYFGIEINMLTMHKAADVCVWVGSFAYVYFFKKFKLLGSFESYSFGLAFAVGMLIIVFGSSPDVVQFGTTLLIPFGFLCLVSILIHSLQNGLKDGFNRKNILGIISLVSFALSGFNDVLHILGLIDTNMLMPVGSVFGVFFLAASVNQDIEKTYQERDDLVNNLKNKVDEQTRHLTTALSQVQKSQADLVQSARLASLGTLSAGIAHEINNAINYVNGAVIPLERKVMKSIPESDRVITEKLFAAIKEGTNLTVEIVRSLRNFTGLNQAKVKDVNIKDTLVSVLTILKSKLSHIEVRVDIPDGLTINCYQVGLNQIFMNLISNAIDVLPAANGRITFTAKVAVGGLIEILVADNGHGMSQAVQDRMFDPFFTTKEVGKGTGLGLHIVQKEVERHAGTISVESKIDVGTTFTIRLPNSFESSRNSEAA